MLRTIDHINIVVSSLEKTLTFFKTLGFSEGDSGKLEGSWISDIVGLKNVSADYVSLSLPDNLTRIELIQYHTPASERDHNMHLANQLGFRHLAFKVNDIDTVVEKLTSQGVELVGTVQTYPKTGKKLVYFYGPDNILLELAQYPDK